MELFQFHCNSCNKKYNSFNGFINHYNRMKKLKDKKHQNNNHIYNIFGIKPCNNSKCNRFTKIGKFINYNFRKADVGNNGYCSECDKMNYYKRINNGDQLGVFNNINNIFLFQPKLREKIPGPIIDDYTSLLAKYYKLLNVINEPEKLQLYYKLHELAPKVILADDGKGKYNETIRIMKRRIKYFKQMDFDGILFEISNIQRNMKKFMDKINKKKRRI